MFRDDAAHNRLVGNIGKIGDGIQTVLAEMIKNILTKVKKTMTFLESHGQSNNALRICFHIGIGLGWAILLRAVPHKKIDRIADRGSRIAKNVDSRSGFIPHKKIVSTNIVPPFLMMGHASGN